MRSAVSVACALRLGSSEAIAREAGVDKVLIYRYFENFPSLLETFGKEGNYWMSVEELVRDETAVDAESLADWMVLLLTRFLHDLQKQPITQEIMRWELLEGNELTHELATVRDLRFAAALAPIGVAVPLGIGGATQTLSRGD